MPVIPYQPENLQDPVELISAIRTRRGGQLLKLDRMLLHSPPFAAGWNNFLQTVRNNLTLDKKLAELAICMVAILNGANYELEQHAPEFIKTGGTERQLEALQQLIEVETINSVIFSSIEQAVLQLTREMTLTVHVKESTIERIKSLLNNSQQLVELIGVISTYNMVSRYLVALGGQAE
jgi:alkylhydroperoxidase family enzyme